MNHEADISTKSFEPYSNLRDSEGDASKSDSSAAL